MRKKARLSLISIALLAGIACSQYAPAQAASSCKLSDLSIKAKIPFGYRRIPMECPMVAYQKNLSRHIVRGFYFVETPAPKLSPIKQTPAYFIDSQISVTLSMFFNSGVLAAREIHESADYPPSLIEHGGACGGIVAPIELRKGSEWRRGIICVVELPPRGSEKWALIQAFFFDRHLTRPSYEPGEDFEQAARKLFRSIRLRELK